MKCSPPNKAMYIGLKVWKRVYTKLIKPKRTTVLNTIF
jgi:hypothetical protein